MDVTVDPCENFYRYACGGFINETILPDNEGKVNILIIGEKKVHEQLKILIKADIEPNERRPTKLVKKFYKTCMNAGECKILTARENDCSLTQSSRYATKYVFRMQKDLQI